MFCKPVTPLSIHSCERLVHQLSAPLSQRLSGGQLETILGTRVGAGHFTSSLDERVHYSRGVEFRFLRETMRTIPV